MKLWDWRLFAFILLFLALPNIYQLYRVHLIGSEIPDPGSLAIVSQWQFVGLVVEVFQEATVLAIFFFLGSQIRRAASLQMDRAKSVLVFIFIASLVFSLGVFVFRDAFITLIGTSEDIQAQTSAFLGISIFSIPFTLLAAAVIVFFESLRLRRLVLFMAFANVGLRFALDSLFFGGHGFSLDAGVVGVGWSTLLSSAGLLLIGMLLLVRAKALPANFFFSRPTFSGMSDYLRVALGSGTDSLMRNVAYFFMIVRIVNTIGSTEIGGYYLTMQILWSFMLVPVLALADSVKVMVANASGDVHRVKSLWYAAMLITALMMIVWIGLAPGFSTFAAALSDDGETVRWAVTAFGILFIPYVLLSFNTVTDSVFYGVGKTKYLAYQSVLTNGSVYLVGFMLYAFDVWNPTFEGVMVLFSLGILVDTFLTLFFLVRILYYQPEKTASAEMRNPIDHTN